MATPTGSAAKTGLVLDPYFSGTKVRWLLDHVPEGRPRAERRRAGLFGTIDSYLVWKLTGGESHVTDRDQRQRARSALRHPPGGVGPTRCSRLLQIPACGAAAHQRLRRGGGPHPRSVPGLPDGVPIAGMAGDQQAALFGQACFERGMAKNTYGTGCFLLMTTGATPVTSNSGLLTTIAWSLDGRVEYALEGSIFIAGAAIQWLRDELHLIDAAEDSEYFASKVEDSGGVYVVPAFAGLGAPYWDMYARGAIFGLTRGTRKEHITRATLDALAYQTRDVIQAMEADSGIRLQTLRVDGGAVANNLMMQFQADLLGVEVERPAVIETTALGAAYLAGLAVGFWTRDELTEKTPPDRVFRPRMDTDRRERLYRGWKKAVKRSMGWARDDD